MDYTGFDLLQDNEVHEAPGAQIARISAQSLDNVFLPSHVIDLGEGEARTPP